MIAGGALLRSPLGDIRIATSAVDAAGPSSLGDCACYILRPHIFAGASMRNYLIGALRGEPIDQSAPTQTAFGRGLMQEFGEVQDVGESAFAPGQREQPGAGDTRESLGGRDRRGATGARQLDAHPGTPGSGPSPAAAGSSRSSA